MLCCKSIRSRSQAQINGEGCVRQSTMYMTIKENRNKIMSWLLITIVLQTNIQKKNKKERKAIKKHYSLKYCYLHINTTSNSNENISIIFSMRGLLTNPWLVQLPTDVKKCSRCNNSVSNFSLMNYWSILICFVMSCWTRLWVMLTEQSHWTFILYLTVIEYNFYL